MLSMANFPPQENDFHMNKNNPTQDKKTRGTDRTRAERQRRFRAKNKLNKLIASAENNGLMKSIIKNQDSQNKKVSIDDKRGAEIAVLVYEIGRMTSLLQAFIQTLGKPDRERFRAQLEKQGVTETLTRL